MVSKILHRDIIIGCPARGSADSALLAYPASRTIAFRRLAVWLSTSSKLLSHSLIWSASLTSTIVHRRVRERISRAQLTMNEMKWPPKA